MSAFARVKSGFTIFQLEEHGTNLLQKITKLAATNSNIQYEGELNDFMTKSSARNIQKLKDAIYTVQYPATQKSNINRFDINNSLQIQNPIQDFYLCALFKTARKLSGYTKGSNPTWFKKVEIKRDFDLKQVISSFVEIYHQMHNDLRNSLLLPSKQIYHHDYVADARNVSCKPNSIDAVITSPPYLTRIDYAISTQLELLTIKDKQYLRQIRINTMGSPVITEKKIVVTDNWGKTCLNILNQIKSHDSKASKTYYWKNIVQYFDDAYSILRQIYKVLNSNKSALLVVQSSYYKDVEIPLNKIYEEMALSIGFTQVNEPFSEVVKGHMAHVNTKSSTYRKNKVYYETVVELIK